MTTTKPWKKFLTLSRNFPKDSTKIIAICWGWTRFHLELIFWKKKIPFKNFVIFLLKTENISLAFWGRWLYTHQTPTPIMASVYRTFCFSTSRSKNGNCEIFQFLQMFTIIFNKLTIFLNFLNNYPKFNDFSTSVKFCHDSGDPPPNFWWAPSTEKSSINYCPIMGQNFINMIPENW